MSTGQKAWRDEEEESALHRHMTRLEELGYYEIANIQSALRQQLRNFEESHPSLSRSGWAAIDQIKKLVEKLG